MGLDAQVIAIGPFNRAIVNCLEYPPNFYRNVEEGTTVVSNVFIAGTSSSSYFLATCFGVEAWDLGEHELNPELADIRALIDFGFADEVHKFTELRKASFKFYYLPNS